MDSLATVTRPRSLTRTYKQDRAWADRFMPQVIRLIAPHLLVPAPDEWDCEEATDLIVLRARDMRIGVRLRQPGYAERYPNQFTLRFSRTSGAKTEFRKVLEGWGDWFFYGHTTERQTIAPWWLIDLDVFRWNAQHHIPTLPKSERPHPQGNTNGETAFIAFPLSIFKDEPRALVIAARP